MDKQQLKESLRPLYENMRFLHLIFEKKDALKVQFYLENGFDQEQVKTVLFEDNKLKEYNALCGWMNWDKDILTEAQYPTPDSDGVDLEFDDSSKYDDQPPIDPENEQSYSIGDFPQYVIYAGTENGRRKYFMEKVHSTEELTDFLNRESDVEDTTNDFDEAKRIYFGLGGKEEDLKL